MIDLRHRPVLCALYDHGPIGVGGLVAVLEQRGHAGVDIRSDLGGDHVDSIVQVIGGNSVQLFHLKGFKI
jgi:hypothetical protein